ncbi:hypothetical protein RKD54_003901 [Pseudarthrobacter sp. SLBN-100]
MTFVDVLTRADPAACRTALDIPPHMGLCTHKSQAVQGFAKQFTKEPHCPSLIVGVFLPWLLL